MSDLQVDKFKERLKECVDYQHLSVNAFAIEIGHKASVTLSNTISGRSIPRVSLLNDIVSRFPEFNLDWLVTGRGQMLLRKEFQSQNRSDDKLNEVKSNQNFFKALERAESEIETLKDYNQHLKEENLRLKRGPSRASVGT